MRIRPSSVIALLCLLVLVSPGVADVSGDNLTWQLPAGHTVTAGSGGSWIYDSTLGYLEVTTPSYPQGVIPAGISLAGSVSLKNANGHFVAGFVQFYLGWDSCVPGWNSVLLGTIYAGSSGHTPFTLTSVVPNPCPSASPIYVELKSKSTNTAIIDSTDPLTMSWQSH